MYDADLLGTWYLIREDGGQCGSYQCLNTISAYGQAGSMHFVTRSLSFKACIAKPNQLHIGFM